MTQCSGISKATGCKVLHCMRHEFVIWLRARKQQRTLHNFEGVLLATEKAICTAEVSTD